MDFLVAAAVYTGCAVGCLLVADFITGLLHWAEDTWLAPGRSRLLDQWIVNDNIGHHRWPGKIRAGHYWQTNRVCIVMALVTAAICAAAGVRAWEAYFIIALLSQSNQIHLWGHSAQPPRAVAALQRVGLLQSARHHAKHHKIPYAVRFCTMTELLNPLLDGIGFWRALEALVIARGAKLQRASAARGGY
jgi:ubiquitin-conjugating enzyme E2 variant